MLFKERKSSMSLAVKQVPQAAPCCATGSHSSSISTRSQFAPKEMAVGGMAAVSGSPPSAWPPSPATYPLDQHLLIFPVAPCLEKGNTMLLRRVERGCADSMAPSSKPGHLKITPAVLFEWETHPTMGQNLRTCPPIAWGVEELPSDRCKASWERCISSCGLGNAFITATAPCLTGALHPTGTHSSANTEFPYVTVGCLSCGQP